MTDPLEGTEIAICRAEPAHGSLKIGGDASAGAASSNSPEFNGAETKIGIAESGGGPGFIGAETKTGVAESTHTPWISLSVDSLVELLRTGEVSCPEQWKVTLTDSAKQHAKDIAQKPREPFESMFPDGDEDLKIQVTELTQQLFERDQEEIQFRQSIKTLQNEVAVLADVQSENVKLKERIEELEALGDARVATINQWCDRAESFGVRDLAGLTAVSEDYKALRTLMCCEPANVTVEVERLKMQLVNVLTGRSELRAKAIREAAAAFRYAARPELDNRTVFERAREMDETGSALDHALDDAARP